MPASDNVDRLRREILQWLSPSGADDGAADGAASGAARGRISRLHAMRLVHALDQPVVTQEQYLSTLAELECARRLLRARCTLEVESATPTGRHADFRVQRDDTVFFMHIKRLWMGEHAHPPALPPQLQALQDVPRALVLAVTWESTASAADLEWMRAQVKEFAAQASVGDECVIERNGTWIGRCVVQAPHLGSDAGPHALVQAIDPREIEDAVPRAQRLLRRAYSQFMHGHPNVICVVGDDPLGAAVLDRAVLGSVIERWDHFPARGQRVAYGRSDEGFWSAGQFEASHTVAWLSVRPQDAAAIWQREGGREEPSVRALLREAFDLPNSARQSSPTA